MYDDRPLVDLLNRRFDDLTARVDDIKRDMREETKTLTVKFDEHEDKDQERFSELDKFKWQATGIFVTLMFLMQFAEKFIERFIKQ